MLRRFSNRITMVRTIFLGVLAVGALSACGPRAPVPAAGPVGLRVLTFNVLVDFEKDWDARKEQSATLVKDAQADLIGLEETSPNQLAFFQGQLPEYDTVGPVPLTPADIDSIAERIPPIKALGLTSYTDVILLYRKDLFEKIEEGHWWLSPTPEVKVSVGFGNVFPRLAVWAKLRHKPSGRELYVVVTHFDNTQPSQEKMAALSHEKMQPFVAQNLPIIFMGDFNTDQNRGDYPLLTSNGWRDSYLASPKASPTGRDNNVPTAGKSRIDHIFYYGQPLTAKEWRRLEAPDPEAVSDHYPVFAQFEWK